MKQLFTSLALIAGIAANAQSLHGDMETSRSVHVQYAPSAQLESPLAWYSTDSLIFMATFYFPSAHFSQQVSKTIDAHSGTYAAKLVTALQDTFGILPALLTNAMPVANMLAADPATLVGGTSFYGGDSVTHRIDTLSAWIKYLPRGADTAKIVVKAVLTGQAVGGADSVLGGGTLLIPQTYNSYTLVSVNLSYTNSTVVPDKIFVFFESSNKAPKDSSTLYVDDVSATTTSTFVNNVSLHEEQFAYPNPSTGLFYIAGLKAEITCRVYNSMGQAICEKKLMNNEAMDLTHRTPGIYFYYLAYEQGKVIHEGKLSIIK